MRTGSLSSSAARLSNPAAMTNSSSSKVCTTPCGGSRSGNVPAICSWPPPADNFSSSTPNYFLLQLRTGPRRLELVERSEQHRHGLQLPAERIEDEPDGLHP